MVTFRRMEEKDVETVSRIEEETFSKPWSPASFFEMLKSGNTFYIVAEEDGEILGSCGVLQVLDEGNITNVVVKKESRGRGIGTAMLKVLLEEGNKQGISAYTLEVRASNSPAIHVYEKLGFVSEGIRKNFYEKPREDANIMWKR